MFVIMIIIILSRPLTLWSGLPFMQLINILVLVIIDQIDKAFYLFPAQKCRKNLFHWLMANYLMTLKEDMIR